MPDKIDSSHAEEQECIDTFVRRMLSSTVKLVRIENNQPASVCSGFILKRNKRYTLFTVLHSFQRNKADLDDLCFDGWHLETDMVIDGNTVMIALPPIEFVKEARMTKDGIGDLKHVDMVWGHIDVAKLGEKFRSDPRLAGKDVTLPCYTGALDRLPDKDHCYGFASHSKVELVPRLRRLIRDPVYEMGMDFEGYDGRGLCRFKLANHHQGHEIYNGASGSPIADNESVIVALVQGGCVEEKVIYGLPLAHYAIVQGIADLEDA